MSRFQYEELVRAHQRTLLAEAAHRRGHTAVGTGKPARPAADKAKAAAAAVAAAAAAVAVAVADAPVLLVTGVWR